MVIIGNGMAGMRCVEKLINLASDDYDMTVFGAEPHGNYKRIMLNSFPVQQVALRSFA